MDLVAPAPRASTLRRVGPAVLGIAMGVSNAIGYVFVLVLSSGLGPAAFGGFSALNTYSLLLAIPAGAFQIVVARRVAAGRHGTDAVESLWVGALLGTVTVLLAPLLTGSFHLPSVVGPLAVAVSLLPMTLNGVFQGMLLGASRLVSLSALYLVTAFTRLLAAVVAVQASWSVTGVFLALTGAGLITAVWGGWLARDVLRPVGRIRPERSNWRELVHGNATYASLFALSSIDIILARQVLPPAQSGNYALASVFGKAVFWGTQFIALSIVPEAAGGQARRVTLRAGWIVLALGGAATAICALAPKTLITLTGGTAYQQAPQLIAPFALVGTLWALTQVWVFGEMGRGHRALGAIAWSSTILEAILVLAWLHHSPGQVLLATGLSAALVAVAGWWRVIVPGERSPGLRTETG